MIVVQLVSGSDVGWGSPLIDSCEDDEEHMHPAALAICLTSCDFEDDRRVLESEEGRCGEILVPFF